MISAQPIYITVWVHGTYPALSVLKASWSPVRKMVYAEPGLSLAKKLPKNYYFYQLAQSLSEHNSARFCIDHFYTYGWHSSNVRPSHRVSEGAKLYQEIVQLLDTYKLCKEKIIVQCVGFSHGGNVILNMVPHLPFRQKNISLEIILLGTPVQESTRHFINSKYVNKAYAFYSDGDWIQKIDMQKLHSNCPKGAPFWSQRTFNDRDAVHQICMTINGKKIGHTKYRSFMPCLSDMLDQVETAFKTKADSKTICFDYQKQDKKKLSKRNVYEKRNH